MTSAMQRILYIDDEADILEVAVMSLEKVGGYEVKTCTRGAEGVAQAPKFQPDLILLDVMMPDMDGPATLRQLKSIPALKDVPVVFMTAKVQSSETAHYRSLGAAGVIAKPFDPMTLPGEVKKYFDSSRQ